MYQYYKGLENSVLCSEQSKYHLNELLDSGAQGGVYKATNKKMNEIVALKLQTSIPDNEQRILNLFIQQQNQMHYNVRVYEVFQYQSFWCVVMEYANDGNLYNFLITNREINDKYEMMKQIAEGVQELHKLNLIHRDIKPENVVVFNQDGNRHYKLCDIGLIKIIAPDFIDIIGAGSGTPSFQAPEMIDSTEYNQKVDIWALAILFYEIHTQCTISLFQGDNEKEIYKQIRAYEFDQEAIKDQIAQSGLQSNIAQLIISMLNPQPQLRPDISKVLEKLQPQQCIRINVQPATLQKRIAIKIINQPQVIKTPKSENQTSLPIKLIQNPSIKIITSPTPSLQCCNQQQCKQQQQLQKEQIIQQQDLIDNLQKQLSQTVKDKDDQELQFQIKLQSQMNSELNESLVEQSIKDQFKRQSEQLVQQIEDFNQILTFIHQVIFEQVSNQLDLQFPKIQIHEKLQGQLDKIIQVIAVQNQRNKNIQESHETEIKILQNQILELKKDMQLNQDKFDKEKSEFKTELNQMNDMIQYLQNESLQIKAYHDQELNLVKKKLNDQNSELITVQNELAQTIDELKQIKQQIEERNNQLQQAQSNIFNLQRQLERVKEQLTVYEQENKNVDNQDFYLNIDQKEGIQYFNIEDPLLQQSDTSGQSLNKRKKWWKPSSNIISFSIGVFITMITWLTIDEYVRGC